MEFPSGLVGWIRRPRVRAMVAVVVLIIVGLNALTWKQGLAFAYHIDMDVYRGGSKLFLEHKSLYDGLVALEGIHDFSLPFTYPPLSAVLFVPLALLPLSLAGLAIVLLSAAALWFTLVLASRHLGAARGDARWLALLALPVGLVMEPVTQTFSFGQVNLLLMVAVAADVLLPRTPWPRGMMIGLAAAIKLTPAVFGLSFLLRRDWRSAVTSVLSGVGFTAIAWLLSPSDSLRYWTEVLEDTSRIGGLAYAGNQSITGALTRLVPEALIRPIWLVGVVAVLVVCSLVMLRLLRRGLVLPALLVNALVALFASPVSWSHHWVWLAPMLLVLGVSAYRARDRVLGTVAVAVGVCTTVLQLHWIPPREGNAELQWPWYWQILGNDYLLLGAAVLAVFALRTDSLARSVPGIAGSGPCSSPGR